MSYLVIVVYIYFFLHQGNVLSIFILYLYIYLFIKLVERVRAYTSVPRSIECQKYIVYTRVDH